MKAKKYWLAATEVPKNFKSRVRAMADAMDVTIAALVIMALTEFMERQKEPAPEVSHAPVEFARAVLADESAVILDTETTGLDGAFVVEIAIMGVDGRELLNQRVNPQVPIPKGATRCHGITDEMVADCPTFAQVLPRIEEAVKGRRVLIYNAEYDMGVLRNELRRTGLDSKEWGKLAKWEDVMMPYSEWVGDRWPEWSHYAGQVKWQKLPGGDHSAMGDCRATLNVLKKMAKYQ